MARSSTTADRIAEAARLHFNEKGYAVTTVAEIATAVGISPGNLTYHYPTKRDLVTRLQEEVAERVAERRASLRAGAVEHDYVDRLRFVMMLTAQYRFLLRDDAQIEPGPDHQTPRRILVDDFAALRAMIGRVDEAGLFRSDLDIDLDVLTRSLWIFGRYWMDHLSEMEPGREIGPVDEQRGVEHHFALLLPNLVAAGRRRFEAALTGTSHPQPS